MSKYFTVTWAADKAYWAQTQDLKTAQVLAQLLKDAKVTGVWISDDEGNEVKEKQYGRSM